MGKWSEITLLIGGSNYAITPFITGSWGVSLVLLNGVSLGVITPLNFGILVVLEAWRLGGRNWVTVLLQQSLKSRLVGLYGE